MSWLPRAQSAGALYLLNCRECDSFVSVTDSRTRCLCGKSTAVEAGQEIEYQGGPLRLWALSWEGYDRGQLNESEKLMVVCESRRRQEPGRFRK